MSMEDPAWSATFTAETVIDLSGMALGPLPAVVMLFPAGSVHATPLTLMP